MDANSVSIAGNPKYNYTLTRDLAGRIIQKIETIGGAADTYDYAYDDNGRLTEVKKNSMIVESYTYDSNGNRLTDGSKTYSYSPEDHLITAGNDAYQFDADGFLIQKTTSAGTMTPDYSSRGELLSASLPSGTVITYDHDPMGRRIAKRVGGVITEKYLWKDAVTLLAVYDGSDNLVMRFNYADGRLPVSMLKGGSTYYLLYDQIGTLKAISDTSGNIIKQIDYDSFGNIISDTNPAFTVPFGFAGGLHDRDTGLVRFGYRDYDPSIGRWTAKDPIDFAGGDSNLYGYVQNDPVNLVDPTGEFGIPGAIMGTVLGATSGFMAGMASGDGVAGLLSGAAGAVAGGTAGAIVGLIAPNASAVAGGVIGGIIGGSVAGATNVRLTKGPCAEFVDYADAVVFGGFAGALMGGIGGGIISASGMSGAAIEVTASLITMPINLGLDIAISNLLN